MFMRVRKSLPVRSIPPAKSFTPGGGFQTFWNSWNVSEDFEIPTLAKCEKAVPEICEGHLGGLSTRTSLCVPSPHVGRVTRFAVATECAMLAKHNGLTTGDGYGWCGASPILFVRDGFKMIWIAARFDTAKVVDHQAFWDWADVKLVCRPMNARIASEARNRAASIALFSKRPLPHPARRRIPAILHTDSRRDIGFRISPAHRIYSSVRVWEMRPAVNWATPPVASCTARDGRAERPEMAQEFNLEPLWTLNLSWRSLPNRSGSVVGSGRWYANCRYSLMRFPNTKPGTGSCTSDGGALRFACRSAFVSALSGRATKRWPSGRSINSAALWDSPDTRRLYAPQRQSIRPQ
jgi:hypothetical protein